MTTETKKLIIAFFQENCADFMYAAYIADNRRRVQGQKAIYQTYFKNKGCDWGALSVAMVINGLTPSQEATFLKRFELVYDLYLEIKKNNP